MRRELEVIFNEVYQGGYYEATPETIMKHIEREIPDEELRSEMLSFYLEVVDVYNCIKEGEYSIEFGDLSQVAYDNMEDMNELLDLFFRHDDSIKRGKELYCIEGAYGIGEIGDKLYTVLYDDVQSCIDEVTMGYDIENLERFWELHKILRKISNEDTSIYDLTSKDFMYLQAMNLITGNNVEDIDYRVEECAKNLIEYMYSDIEKAYEELNIELSEKFGGYYKEHDVLDYSCDSLHDALEDFIINEVHHKLDDCMLYYKYNVQLLIYNY